MSRKVHSAIASSFRHKGFGHPQGLRVDGIDRLAISHMSVPTSAQVRRGASVSIVLKADQRTGKEVKGQVQDVLTKGNHPRGIKVRLQDGRIGRVQRMVAGLPLSDTSLADASRVSNRNSLPGALTGEESLPPQTGSQGTTTSQRPRYMDVRLDDNRDQPPEQLDLLAYVKPAKQKRVRKQTTTPAVTVEVTDYSCPVCGQFKGDETAVAHHVEMHFNNT